MNTIVTALTTIATFSDDGTKRYLLQKTWDDKKPRLAIVMLAPSEAAGVSLDNTTMLVLNNAQGLGFGSVAVVNLFATLNDFDLKEAEAEDADNLKHILEAAQKADTVVYAPGVGKAKNKRFQQRQNQVLAALKAVESKLHCLCSADGDARLQHPLSPAVREWHLSPLKVSELLPQEAAPAKKADTKQKKIAPIGKETQSAKAVETETEAPKAEEKTDQK